MRNTSNNTNPIPIDQQENPLIKFYNEWRSSTPCVTRLSVLAIIWIYLFSWFFDLDSILSNITFFTIMEFEIYRIILSPMVGNSFITIIVLFLFYPTMGTRMESGMASSAFLALLATLSLLTNLIFNLICIIGSLLGMKILLIVPCSGFWLIVFPLIVIECMAMPDVPRQMFLIPIQIPSKYFPLVLYGFFCLFGGLELDLACAIGVGYLYALGYLDRIKPSATYLAQLESTGCLRSPSMWSGWVPAGSALGHTAWAPVSQNDPSSSDGNNSGANSSFSMGSWGGFGNNNSQTTPAANPFPGSGRTLSNQTQSESSWGSSILPVANPINPFPQLGSVPPPTLGGSSHGLSREELSAKRLAALESASKSTGDNNPPSTSTNPDPNSDDPNLNV